MPQVLTDDGRDLLVELNLAGARFLVVGAHALAVHGVSRATVDLDVWVDPTPENAERVIEALRAFGAPLAVHGVTAADLSRDGSIYQMGLPPNRIDILTSITAVGFDEAWRSRVVAEVDGVSLSFLGLEQIVQNKQSTGRTKDMADCEALAAVSRRNPR